MICTVIQPTMAAKPFPKLMSFTYNSSCIILATSITNDNFINGFVIASTHLELSSTVREKATNLVDFAGEVILKN